MTRGFVVLVVLFVCSVASAAPKAKLHAHLVDAKTGEPLVGATIVAPLAVGENVEITDENGMVMIAVEPGTTTLTIYYNNDTQHVVVAAGGKDFVEVGKIALEVKPPPPCCVFDGGPSAPMIDFDSSLVTIVERPWPVSRTRDSSAVVALSAGAPARQTTWLDGDRRLAGAPAVSLGLLEEVEVFSMRGATNLDHASDGISVATRSGSNDNKGAARIALGTEGTELEAGVGGPIVADSAWWWAGAVLGPDGQQELARVTYAATPDEQGSVVALHQSLPATIAPGERAIVMGDERDDWASAEWVAKLDEGRLDLIGGASGERLDDGSETTRGAVHARIHDRFKAEGYHNVRLFGELGEGTAASIGHRDASASGGDDWMIFPELTIEAGVRWDERWFGSAHADVWQPHATIGYDWTKEGRAQAFVTADRASLLDAGLIGNWLTTPRWRDDVATGASYEVKDDWMITAAVRTRELAGVRRTGLDGALDHRGRIELHVTASSVERAMAGYATLRVDGVRAGVMGRWAAADDIYGSQAGALASWHHSMDHGMSTDVGAEVVTDRVGKLARVVVGFSY
ncbi:MAG TPA: hypothetical protein VGO00_20405 [Kofleriaceae bacterium]|nr:hypothetical protein [Kofleriaceae bacterium]